MKLRKKGFTLIELLGVIVILAIIALIATPIILGVIEKVRLNAFINTNYGVIDAIEKECSIGTLTGTKCKDAYTFGEKDSELKVKGQAPSKGIIFNENNKDTMMYTESSDGYCARKDLNGNIVAGKLIDNKCVIKDTYDYHHNDTSVGFSGAGTEQDPYQISSIEDLAYFSKECSNYSCSYINNYFVLTTSLDFQNDDSYINSTRTDFGDINGNEIVEDLKTELTTEKGFYPIVLYDMTKLNFDGKNHAIKNLFINRNNGVGLFYNIVGIRGSENEASFSNLEFIDANLIGTNSLGVLSGEINDINLNVTNLILSFDIEGTSGDIGGLIGKSYSAKKITISNVYTEGSVKGANELGGILGYTSPNLLINNVINRAEVTANTNYSCYAGGLIGTSTSGNYGLEKIVAKISNSANFGNISGPGYIGGLISETNRYAELQNLYNFGDLNSGSYTGGIIGVLNSQSTITNVKNYGIINTTGDYNGGIFGYSTSNNKLSNSNNYGDLFAKKNIDGLIGYDKSICTIENSNNFGTITITE